MKIKTLKLAIVGLLTCGIQVYYPVTAQAQNLIVNPDFEDGNTGFYSDYLYSQWDLLNEGTISVISNPHWAHGGAEVYGDQTNGAGNMLVVNGSIDSTKVVWGTIDPLHIETNTDYQFEAWISRWYDLGSGSLLTFQAKDEFGNWFDLGIFDTSTIDVAEWTPFTVVWNSGESTMTELRLMNGETAVYGNDFAIDHLSFTKATNVPEAAGMLFFGITGLAAILRRRRWVS